MRRALFLVPVLFLLGLVYLAYGMYQGTRASVPCTGEECAGLTDQELADMVLEANGQ